MWYHNYQTSYNQTNIEIMDYTLNYKDQDGVEKNLDVDDVAKYEYDSQDCTEPGRKNMRFYNDDDEIVLEIFDVYVLKIEAS